MTPKNVSKRSLNINLYTNTRGLCACQFISMILEGFCTVKLLREVNQGLTNSKNLYL